MIPNTASSDAINVEVWGGPEERITARVNGCAVPVCLSHRYGSGRNGVLVTVTAPVRLSLEQAAAALYHAGMNNTDEDLADDDTVRELVAEAVVNGGCCELNAAQMEARDATATGGADAAFLARCRARVAAVFTAPDPALVVLEGGDVMVSFEPPGGPALFRELLAEDQQHDTEEHGGADRGLAL